MEELKKQVRRAHRRMGFQRFAVVLGWCWFATLLMGLGVIAVDKLYPTGVAAVKRALGAIDEFYLVGSTAEAWAAVLWPALVIAASLGIGLVVAAVWIIVTRREPLGAAIEIDRRFGLKERVSSTVAMPPEDRHTEAGRALVADAVRRASRIDVAGRFSIAPGKTLLLPLLPGVLAMLVALFVAQAKTEGPPPPQPKPPVVNKQVKKSTADLRKKLAQRRKRAEEMGLEEAKRLFEKLQEAARDMEAGNLQRKDALVKLNELARELQKHRDRLGGAEKIKKQLDQLKDLERGPADKFAKAVREGDLVKAAEELEAIKRELAGEGLTDEQKQQLANQLQQMQQKLNQMAQANREARQQLQQKIDQLRNNGQLAEADKLQQQLDKLLQQAPQLGQLEQMADKLEQCADCLREGEFDNALAALDQLQDDLEQQLAEMDLMEEAMEQLRQARNQMNCQQCGGFG